MAFRRLCGLSGPSRPIGMTRRGSVRSRKRAIAVRRHIVRVRAGTTSGIASRGVVITNGRIAIVSAIALSNLRGNAGCRLGN